ncbi:SPOSA6832_00109 [Sporobolomyces salmonicolor]|uniref:Pyridoxal phosphate homeostasis protein n=1 Tax=Sporidiobolus salmonicolor TaxID=5005 RepID=A0A0D6EGJ1_SPOSA|nr:SPOSA6832_00109 [Sporobolomyces salmonicolor]
MPVDPPAPERAQELVRNYDLIRQQVDEAAAKCAAASTPRLVAVSKYKPSSDIVALYDHGVRHFGENYPQELDGKAKESHSSRRAKEGLQLILPRLRRSQLPRDIAWHYIGTLQSNKCKMLASIPNLFAIETLTSLKSANLLHSTLSSLSPPRDTPLHVNTSGESQKSGLAPLSSSQPTGEALDLALHIVRSCPTLRLTGLMTIGSFDASTSDAPNPDFEALKQTRELLLEGLRSAVQDDAELKGRIDALEQEGGLELSMGMSSDFIEAIEQGSTNVRVGSSIFGARPVKR